MAKTNFMTRFELLCAEHGLSVRGACAKIGLSVSTSTNWKKGYLPNVNTQQKIADYFNISIAELMGFDEEGTETLMNDDQLELIKTIKRLNEDDLAFVLRIVKLLVKDV